MIAIQEEAAAMNTVIPSLQECPIKVGQVYASKHINDVEEGERQTRRVVNVELGADSFVWLRTHYNGEPYGAPTRIRLRSPRARTIPGYRLVTA